MLFNVVIETGFEAGDVLIKETCVGYGEEVELIAKGAMVRKKV